MSQSTAGKGPGIVFRTSQGPGAIRLSARPQKGVASLEVLDSTGSLAILELGADELRVLARALLKVETTLHSAKEEVTQT